MEINRRFALKGGFTLAGGFALTAGLSLSKGLSGVGNMAFANGHRPLYAAARKDRDGSYSAALFNDGGDVRTVPLPARGHDIAVRPGTGDVVFFARRPGRFGICFSANNMKAPQKFLAQDGRHFYGHGVFSGDGRLLYTTEQIFDDGTGVIGVRDATNGYAFIGEIASHGIGPHDLALLDDGVTMVVAHGGIETHPETGRQILNLASMEPSLVYLNMLNGDLIEKVTFPKNLKQLSIRHLTVARHDRVVFGCQYKGPVHHAMQLIAMHDRGGEIKFTQAPDDLLRDLKNYVGSITADRSGEIVAASCPRGNLVTFWRVSDGSYLGNRQLKDGCGIARTASTGEFLLTSGAGDVARFGSLKQPLTQVQHVDGQHWDNHAVFVGDKF